MKGQIVLKAYFFVAVMVMVTAGTSYAQVFYDQPETPLDPVIFDDDIEFWAELEEEGTVYMDWTKYAHNEPFTYYKIVRSQDNPNPVYPEDGFIFYDEDISTLEYIDPGAPVGESYYRVCQIAGTKRYCSTEVQKIVKPPALIDKNLIDKKIELEAVKLDQADKLTLPIRDKITLETAGSDVADSAEVAGTGQGEITSEKPEKEAVVKSSGFDIEKLFSEYWVQLLALIVSLIGVALAVTGFTVAGAKKKKSVSKFINQIDDTFASFKWKSKRCEAELYRLEDLVEDQLKAGKIEDSTYHLLINRIHKYLEEIKDIDQLPPHLKEEDKEN